jgi:hypothetical protein
MINREKRQGMEGRRGGENERRRRGDEMRREIQEE